MTKQLTTAVIGCGNISKFHFDGLAAAKAKVKYVCDINATAARRYCDRFQAIYEADYNKIVQDPEVDVSIITTPSPTHLKIVGAAIQAGKAVICEKTLATNAEDALTLVKQSEQAGTILFTSYMKRYIPAVIKAKELLPELGTLISGTIRGYQNWGDLFNPTAEKIADELATPDGRSKTVRNYGGGILYCGGSHLLDLVLFFFGRPSRVYAQIRDNPQLGFEIQATAILDTASCPVSYEVVAHPLTKIGFLREGWEEEITITGTKGRLTIFSSLWDQPTEKSSLLRYYNNNTGSETEFRYDPISPFTQEILAFLADIAENKQTCQSRYTGYEVDRLIATMFRSSVEKNALNVDWSQNQTADFAARPCILEW